MASLSTGAPFLLASASDAVLLAGFAYMALLGLRSTRRSGQAGYGASLLVAAVVGFISWMGVEVDIPITVTPPQGADPYEVEIPILRTIAEIAVASAAGGLLVRLLNAWRTWRGMEPLLHFQATAMWLGITLMGLVVIYQVHYAERLPIRTAILSIGGASVFIIGLALQSTLGNVFAGYGLQAARAFKRGDHVQIGHDGPVGVILDSTLAVTRIVTRDGQMLVLPNSAVLQKDFMNLDRPTPRLRRHVRVGVSYEIPPAVVKDACLQVLNTDPDILSDPEPEVVTEDFGDSAVIYDLRFWIPGYRVHDDVMDRVRTRTWYALRDAGLEIPFPIRTVRMASMDAERARDDESQSRTDRVESALARCDLFDEASVGRAERRELARSASEMELAAGAHAVRKGERSDAMFVVARGTCRVLLSRGEPVTVSEGGHFGEIALLTREPRTADVVAGPEGAVVIRLPRPSVLPILARRPEYADRFEGIADTRRALATGIDPSTDSGPKRGGLLRAMLELVRPV